MKFLAVFSIAFILSGCWSAIKNYETISKTTNMPLNAAIGSELYQIKKTRDLPNAFGKADIYGGKVDTGFRSLYFAGLTSDNKIVFRLTSLNDQSSETTMSRYGDSSASMMSAASVISAISAKPAQKSDSEGSRIPPNTIEFLFDPEDKILKLEDVSIEILEVSKYSIKYIIRPNI